MTDEEAKEIVRKVCEHAWMIECRCCLRCHTYDCYNKESDEQINCMCEKYMKGEIED